MRMGLKVNGNNSNRSCNGGSNHGQWTSGEILIENKTRNAEVIERYIETNLDLEQVQPSPRSESKGD